MSKTIRVIETRLVTGRQVSPGDLLIQLDSSTQRLQMQEEIARVAALGPEITSVREQMASEERTRGAERQAAVVAGDQGPCGSS